MSPLVAVPVSCEALGPACTPAQEAAVRTATRMELEFAGFHVVDAETLNNELSWRQETTTEVDPVTSPANPTGAVRARPPGDLPEDPPALSEKTGGFTALPPEQQRAFLLESGVQGVLSVSISLGPLQGLIFPHRDATIAITMTRVNDGALAWYSRCHVDTGKFHTEELALELATRCALESATLW